MSKKTCNINLALRLAERYDHRCAIGIIRYSRTKENWRLFGSESLFFTRSGQRGNAPDGIIARITSRQDLERLKAYNVPLIDIAGSFRDAGLIQIVNDDAATGVAAARHFLVRGFQHFAYIAVNDMIWSDQRREGFAGEVAQTLGAEVSVFTLGAPWRRADGILPRLAKWLGKLPRPCAVMAANDLIAYRAGVAASWAELAVPQDIALAGVDNEDLYCELSQPKLTSIACDCEAIGYAAAAALDRVLSGRDCPRHNVVPPGIIESRASSDIVIGEDSLVREVKNYIRANISLGVNATEVARHFPLSRRSLERRFRQAEGRALHQTILEIRLEKARQLLGGGKKPTEAGYESGFISIQHFHRVFKKGCGVTPREYAASVLRARDDISGNGR